MYTITYEAQQSAQAWFQVKMTADALGDRPMQTEKAVEITGGGSEAGRGHQSRPRAEVVVLIVVVVRPAALRRRGRSSSSSSS